jgi:hypothetical protein
VLHSLYTHSTLFSAIFISPQPSNISPPFIASQRVQYFNLTLFPKPPLASLRPAPPPIRRVLMDLSLLAKLPGRQANHLLQSSAEVMNERQKRLFPYMPGTGDILTFLHLPWRNTKLWGLFNTAVALGIITVISLLQYDIQIFSSLRFVKGPTTGPPPELNNFPPPIFPCYFFDGLLLSYRHHRLEFSEFCLLQFINFLFFPVRATCLTPQAKSTWLNGAQPFYGVPDKTDCFIFY